jgi:uncharacterized protein YegL
VQQRLVDLMRTVSRDFDIEEVAAAEAKINGRFEQPLPLDEGITVYRCTARLSPDGKARAYLDARRSAERAIEVKQAQHMVNRDSTRYTIELEGMRHDAEMARRRSELEGIGSARLDPRRLVALHLAKHPEDTQRAMDLLIQYERAENERAEVRDQRRAELFKFMVENNLVHAIDVDDFRADVISRIHRPDTAVELPQSSSWVDDEAPPAVAATPPAVAATPAAVEAEPPVAAEARPAADVTDTTGWDSTLGILPVYVVVEESEAVQPWIDELDAGIASLHAALAGTPAAAHRVRLSVLGFADDVTVHRALAAPREDDPRPRFTARGGTRYGNLFADLLIRIPADIAALKAQDETVHRPTVFVLTAGRPTNGADWRALHARLVDRDVLSSAPTIVACGVGKADADTITKLATQPQGAFVAGPDADVRDSIRRFFAALVHSVLQSGMALGMGRQELVVEKPEGFRMAG